MHQTCHTTTCEQKQTYYQTGYVPARDGHVPVIAPQKWTPRPAVVKNAEGHEAAKRTTYATAQ
jgi:hypothetical protein